MCWFFYSTCRSTFWNIWFFDSACRSTFWNFRFLKFTRKMSEKKKKTYSPSIFWILKYFGFFWTFSKTWHIFVTHARTHTPHFRYIIVREYISFVRCWMRVNIRYWYFEDRMASNENSMGFPPRANAALILYRIKIEYSSGVLYIRLDILCFPYQFEKWLICILSQCTLNDNNECDKLKLPRKKSNCTLNLLL